MSIGIVADVHGNFAVFSTPTLGVGVLGGASGGRSFGFFWGDVDDFKGWGFAFGGSFTKGHGVVLEFDYAFDGDNPNDEFGSIGVTGSESSGSYVGWYLEGAYNIYWIEGNIADQNLELSETTQAIIEFAGWTKDEIIQKAKELSAAAKALDYEGSDDNNDVNPCVPPIPTLGETIDAFFESLLDFSSDHIDWSKKAQELTLTSFRLLLVAIGVVPPITYSPA